MLLLTRRIGESIYIGDAIRVTVHDRLRYHVTLGLIAPAHTALHYGGAALAPAVLPDGERLYLVTLLICEALRIGEIELHVDFHIPFPKGDPRREQAVRIGIQAPKEITILREELYLRMLAETGRRLPPPIADWIRRVNQPDMPCAVA
jgi:sRNA-binding carbon storage regulator CsrA